MTRPKPPLTQPYKLPVMSVLGFTGHRPQRLGGYNQETYSRLLKLATWALELMNPKEVISGMAQGWDIEVAFAAIRLGIPVHAALPFVGQEAIWPAHARDRYKTILKRCAKVTVVSEGGYSAHKMMVRNQFIVDSSTHLCALWDKQPMGGTFNCIQYAMHNGGTIINLWDQYTNPPEE